jgi:hypothetical protein
MDTDPHSNLAVLATKALNALDDIATARALIATNGWDGLTANQRKAIMDGILVDVAGIIRYTLNIQDAP